MKKNNIKAVIKNLTDTQKKIIMYLIISIVIIIFLLILIFVNKQNENNQTEKDRLTHYLQKTATNFYEKEYYPQLATLNDDMSTFLSNFTTEGISMSVQVLIDNSVITIDEAKKNMTNKDKNKQCDFSNTKAIIYPQEPYKKNSYKVSVQLDCDL